MKHKLLGFITLQKHHDTPFDTEHLSFHKEMGDSTLGLLHYHDSYLHYRIQYTGELYNYQELLKALQLEEEITPAKLIMIAYAKWGISLLSHLDGIFAFALFDADKAQLFLVKDRVSVKPLYYYHDNKKLLFGSSLKTLSKLQGFEKKLHIPALANYFTYGYIMQPNTIYENCHKIKSGHYLCYDIAKNKISETSYWDLGSLYDQEKLDLDERAFQHEAHTLLQKSIQKRTQGAGTYAASLSGGYDSSTVAALLQHISDKPIKTFTIGFEDASINEAPEAKAIAGHLGTEHIEHYFSDEDALNIIPMLAEVYDEPFYDNGSIPTTLLASIAKSYNVDTIFAGDGGDEVFATADDIERFEKILAFSHPVRKGIFACLNSINPAYIPYIKSYNNIPTKYYKFINMLKAHNIPQMVQVKMTLFHPFEIQQLLQKKEIGYKSVFDDIYFGEHAQSVDMVIGSYFKTFMTDGELIKTTQAFSSQNIAIREPYLDKDLVALMAKVPSHIKIKDGIKKNLLKNIAYQYIPKHLLDRSKKGFSVPFEDWMRHILHPLLMQTLSEENLKKDGILNVSYIIKLRNDFLNGKEAYKYKLWSILLYQLWYEKNIRN